VALFVASASASLYMRMCLNLLIKALRWFQESFAIALRSILDVCEMTARSSFVASLYFSRIIFNFNLLLIEDE